MSLIAFSGQPLAIHWPTFQNSFLPLMQSGEKQAKAYDIPTPDKQQAASADWLMYLLDYYRAPDELGVVVLPLKGVMSRNTSWYNAYGNAFLAALIDRADREESVKGLVLDVFSPGGTVDSTKALADSLYRFTKPAVAHTAYAASAAVWASAQCDRVLLEKQAATEMGSIGTLQYHTDLRGAMEKSGEVTTIFRAKGSPDKLAINSFEELTDLGKAAIQERLDASQKEFVSDVRRGRGGKISSADAFTGRMFPASEAIRLGLADGFGTLGDAVEEVLKLAA